MTNHTPSPSTGTPGPPGDDGGPTAAHLAPTSFLDADHPLVAAWVDEVCAGLDDPRRRAVALFTDVRDRIRYDPWRVTDDPADYRASAVLAAGAAWCVPKAVLLAAGLRAVGIPARLGFADVRNHLTSAKLRERMASDVFVRHGFTELWLDEHWVRVTPTFNRELCERFGLEPLEFDGVHDALFHPYDRDGRRHMEYLRYHPSADDLPLEEVLADLRRHYGDRAFGGGEDPVFAP
ncbi:MAG: transglutaminase family protein [Actinomyces sp.]|nr:MAG: transglutaminase family protein [Actinomyces sp.]